MSSHSLDRIHIPANFWIGLRQIDVSAQDILRKAKLPLTIFTESQFVNTAEYFAIWEAYSEIIDDPAAIIAKQMNDLEISQLPPSVLAPYHARDFRDALKRLARYKQLCVPERFHITEKDELCTIELEWLYSELPEPPMLAGIIMASLLEMGRRGTRISLQAHSVEFSCPVGEIKGLESYFGCRIKFSAERSRLTVRRSDLELPFVSYNADLLDILTPALDRSLVDQQRVSSVIDKVKWIMKRSLAAGRPDIQVVASELGMSDRTLQRRLTDEGTNFKQLLAIARREQALLYLSDPTIDLKEVAFLLGYEEQNSFYRAFRLWEGDTPSNWRIVHSFH
ncbi:AraC family transcriptional regulator ligand-binding domain-containing protein [Paenibacillus sp. 19GGS1-52]|uniref:AraC family transcriptional regulator n=1 Tax=Paenibacillus sp. 19GGS1-52 TaxID=2758563 RepID=UPI001EFBADC0|nr:AraC family transcriptional regulator [Paenibacillus sp. 19GGS1-52]ULO04894.1 AraC family transcriptional regulator ligand-binding domain-containing protein [Paenibacillus sp. 19GGS1-52]